MEIAAYFRASTSARNTDKLCSFNMMACYGEAFRRIAKSKKCAPKAKVRGSNPLGRANQINELRRLFRRHAKGKLTTNSPTERAYWRVIGGHFVTLLP
jgi:hypothetical protein